MIQVLRRASLSDGPCATAGIHLLWVAVHQSGERWLSYYGNLPLVSSADVSTFAPMEALSGVFAGGHEDLAHILNPKGFGALPLRFTFSDVYSWWTFMSERLI